MQPRPCCRIGGTPLAFHRALITRQRENGYPASAARLAERDSGGAVFMSARIAITTKAAPPRIVKIEAIPCTAMPTAATASSDPTPVGVLRAAP
jgi:hypothetical protein